MTVHNAEIARTFDKLANLLEIDGANPFRVRAYRDAARVIGGLAVEAADLVARGEKLEALPGIGRDLAEKIRTLAAGERLPLLEEVERRVPPALDDLLRIDGLGPKRVKTLADGLDIHGPDDLLEAARAGRLRDLPGFGAKTEARIRAGLERLTAAGRRTAIAEAEPVVAALCRYLREAPGVGEVTVAGSYRRRRESVGDLDLLATARSGAAVMRHLLAYEEVARTVSQGKTRSTVYLHSGLQVDLRVVPKASYGAALCYFTGSKAHNIALRRRGVRRGLKINEYGVFRGRRRVGGATEEEVYASVGLPWVAPELREDRGELEAAEAGRLPKLVTPEAIRGDLHAHTDATDGHDTLEAMANAAQARGYEYLAITDHSRRLTVAHGLDEKRLRAQGEAIDALNRRLDGITLFKGIEVDILEDGTLDLPDEVLQELDLAVCAVHHRFGLPQEAQTRRILRAMENPRCTILAHPSGRLLGRREPYAVDMEAIIEQAARCGCILEVNAQPERLDLIDRHCMAAREHGVKLAISTDAHRCSDLDLMRFGVDLARRGWLEANDVVNTLPLRSLRRVLRH